ncbi:MAG: NAD(P)H-dependent glycerol-3-phosphate dehydrogenase [Polyangiaceae bacterium]|jgi:glycerol-3-phosphate dehydrogenase (NAD(P)+)
MTSKVAVLGAGAWGTALAKLLADKGAHAPDASRVVLWSRRRELCDAVNASGENARYLPGAALPKSLVCTDDLGEAIGGADMIVFVVPSHGTRDVARAAAPHVEKLARAGGGMAVPIVSATKGIENDSLMFMDEVLAAELPSHARGGLAFLSGPSFAKELAGRMPTAVVIAARDPDVRAHVMTRFHTPYMRTYASEDIPGVECGGALKNVIAIAAGIVDGMGFGHNTRAALITRGLAEIASIAMARGGSALTLAGLAGMGDLLLTCTGELSRNRTVGYELGKGRKLVDILAGLGHVAEGVKTAKSAYDLAGKLGVDMPITREVHAVLYEDKPVQQAVIDLMSRELGHEFDPRAVARATLR